MVWSTLVVLSAIVVATFLLLYALYEWQDQLKVNYGSLAVQVFEDMKKMHTNVVRVQKELSEDWRPIGRQYRKHRWVYDSMSGRIGFIDEDNSTSQTLRVVFGYTGDLTKKSRVEVDMPIDCDNLTEVSSFRFIDNERSVYSYDRRVSVIFNTPQFGEYDNQPSLCIPIEPNMVRFDVGNLLTGHIISSEFFGAFARDMNLPKATSYFKTNDVEDVRPRSSDYPLVVGDMLLVSYMGPNDEEDWVSHVMIPFNSHSGVTDHTRYTMRPEFCQPYLRVNKTIRLQEGDKAYHIASFLDQARIIAINRVKSFRPLTGSLSHSIVQEVAETMQHNCLLETLNQIDGHWTKEIDLWFDVTVETPGSPVTVRLHWGNVWCIYPFLVPNSTRREWIDHGIEATFLTDEAKAKQCRHLGFFDPMLYDRTDADEAKIKCNCELCEELNDDDEEEAEDTRIPLGSSPDPAYDIEPPIMTGMADAALAVFGPDSVAEAALRELLPSMNEPVDVKPIVPEQEAVEAISNALVDGELKLVYPPAESAQESADSWSAVSSEALLDTIENSKPLPTLNVPPAVFPLHTEASSAEITRLVNESRKITAEELQRRIKEEPAEEWNEVAEIWNKIEQEREKEFLAQPEEGPGDV